MNLLSVVTKSNLLSHGCKRYYEKLFKTNNSSIGNNWLIIDGKYKNQPFIIAKDTEVSKELNMGLTSIYNYKKILKSLGLITTLKKFTTRTNQCKNKHFCQITVLATTMPKKFIAKTLKRPVNIIKATLQKTYNSIITQSKEKINKIKQNLHSKIEKISHKISTLTPNNKVDLNDPTIKKIKEMLDKNNVNYKIKDLQKYKNLYEISISKFESACMACSGADTYSPFNYFNKIFKTYKQDYKYNTFSNFPQRDYDFERLENLLIY